MKVTIDLDKLDSVFHREGMRGLTAVLPDRPDYAKPDRTVDLGHVGYGDFPADLGRYLDDNAVELIRRYAELTKGDDDATVVDGVPHVDASHPSWPDTGIVTTTLSFNSEEDLRRAIQAHGFGRADVSWSERSILLDGELSDDVVSELVRHEIPFSHETRLH
jgi:hypothetical protein